MKFSPFYLLSVREFFSWVEIKVIERNLPIRQKTPLVPDWHIVMFSSLGLHFADAIGDCAGGIFPRFSHL